MAVLTWQVLKTCGFTNDFFSSSVVLPACNRQLCSLKIQQNSRFGPTDTILLLYEKKERTNPKEKIFSALNRGGLIDKLVSAKPAFANCLSNALINQTEEQLWREGCQCFHDFLPLTSQCEAWLPTQIMPFKAVLMLVHRRAHLALVGWGLAQLQGMICLQGPI